MVVRMIEKKTFWILLVGFLLLLVTFFEAIILMLKLLDDGQMFRLRMIVRGKKLKLIIASSSIIKNCALFTL